MSLYSYAYYIGYKIVILLGVKIMGRSLTSISFWFADQMIIEEVDSASDIEHFDLMGQSLNNFEPGHCVSLSQYDNGYYLIQADNGKFMEFSCF